MNAQCESLVNRRRQRFGKPVLLHWPAMPKRAPHKSDVPPRTTPPGNVRGLAAEIAGTLRVARALIASGRPIDLSGLEGPVGLLCAKSLDLPPGQGRLMRVVLVKLLQDIDELSEAIRNSHDGGARRR